MSIKSSIENAYDRWAEAQSDFTKVANQRIGYIKGGVRPLN